MRSISVVIAFALLTTGCAPCVSDIFLSPSKRAFNALKNRTSIPRATDIDLRVTLAAMLEAGDDRTRWQQTRAGTIEGWVVRMHDASPESANCFSASARDAHIEVALRPDAPPNERVIVEITPPMRAWAKQQGQDWSTTTLAPLIVGRRVRFEGWLFFDAEHDEEAENTRPGHKDNWRATAWELHPVTRVVPL